MALPRSLQACLSAFLVVFLATGLFAAETQYVGPGGNCAGGSPCGDTIQSGIDLDEPDLILDIRQGTYIETLSFPSGGDFRRRTFDCGGSVIVDGSLAIQNGAVNLNSGALILQNQGLVPVPVPNVVGMEKSAAQSTLIAANLVLGSEANRGSDTVAVDHVISQSPAAGILMAPSMSVDLTISLGAVAGDMPDVIGMSQSEAVDTLYSAGLIVGDISEQYSETMPSGHVINQDPLPQTRIVWEDPVNLLVSLGPSGGPSPDPETDAPELDRTVSTTMIGAVEFLFTGLDPVQKAVVPGVVEPKRVAVLRGKVSDRLGAPLSDVVVSVLDHLEYGHTLTRDDGMFDLAVNGGGLTTVKYAKEGYLPVQRQVDAPWQDFAWLPDVVLIPVDSQVTSIELEAAIPIQVARGGVVTDGDGSRQATLFFPQGTAAELVLPDGTTQPVTSLSVRATEYTVGDSGPDAMPALLPPASGYTYAVELSVDEAVAKIDGRDVIISQPVVFYVENFLGFPVGGIVPVGYYDNDGAAWVESDNGRIVQVLDTDGLADLDVDGDGLADTGTALSDLGITDAEREQLALLYEPGQSLWRVLIAHLSTYDHNWPTAPPPDAGPPMQPFPEGASPEQDPCEGSGSIIEIQNQILGERIALPGTPFTLNYRSDRVPGRLAVGTIQVPLSGDSVPESLKRIELEVLVAGRSFKETFSANPEQEYTFTWDGLDAYGRPMQGPQPYVLRLCYVYPTYYRYPAEFVQSFALASGGAAELPSLADREAEICQVEEGLLGAFQAKALGLGAWTLDAHHVYDPVGGVLYRGDGGRRSAGNVKKIIITAAGDGQDCYSGPCGDGGPATQAQLGAPECVASSPDGSIYIADGSNRVRRVDPDGTIATVAGNGEQCPYGDPCGDGGPATEARFFNISGIAVSPEGAIYIADSTYRVRRVGPDGIITTVAGTGESGFDGDGGPATEAKFDYPSGVAVDADGSLYIADILNNRVRRVGPNGMVTTVAGGGYAGDGSPATDASLYWPTDVAVGPDGSLYIADSRHNRVRRVGSDGIISTVAGTGLSGFSGDGGPATEADLSVLSVDAGPHGNLYIVGLRRVRRVGTDGIITTAAGMWIAGFNGDGGPATGTYLSSAPADVAVGPDGSLYIADTDNRRIRQVKDVLPEFDGHDIAIPSEDGGEIYTFDRNGRHLNTVHALTGAVLYTFSYDDDGLLTAVEDGDGNTTTIERDANGDPLSIVGPYGQQNTLTLDEDKYLASVANPANETCSFTYKDDGGLLATFTDPRNHTKHFTYDDSGRLIRSEDPAGGHIVLERSDTENGFQVTKTTAEGVATTYLAENLSTGDQRRVNAFPDGTETEVLRGTDGAIQTTNPDGAVIEQTLGPDPRWGMQAPLIESRKVASPGGLEETLSIDRSVVLSDPYDLLSVVTWTETATINGRSHTTTFDAASNNFAISTPTGRQSTVTIDSQGRTVQIQLPSLEPIHIAYDSLGRDVQVTQGAGEQTRTVDLGYDGKGYMSSIADSLERAVLYAYDAAGRVTDQTLPGSLQTLYGYDANGNTVSVTPPGQPVHALDYSPVDLLSAYTPPVVGEGGSQTSYDYNADRQLTRITRADGELVEFDYDVGSCNCGRIVSMALPRGQVDFAYDETTGKLSGIAAPDGIGLGFAYDGSLPTEAVWTGAVAGNVGWSYDNDFRIASESVNGAQAVGFQYDSDGLLVGAGDLAIDRDPQSGFVAGTTLGNVTDSASYNAFGELANYSAAYDGTDIFEIQYSYDKLSRIVQKIETVNEQTDTCTYEYDIAGRLAEVRENDTLIAAYTYDSNGNRLSFTGTNGVVNGTYDDQDRLLEYGDAAYAYTDNGERLGKSVSDDTTTYDYDVLGNLMKVVLPDGTQIEYLIDGANRRIGRKVDGILTQGFLYRDELNPVAELDGGGNVVGRFVYGAKGNTPAYMVKGGNTYRIVSDGLGSPRLVVDATTGDVVQRMDYDAFGNVVSDTNPGFQPFGFAGGLYDPDTGLTRFGARDYDPETGRWTAKDPILFAGGDANLYAYVSNDPLNRADPFGTAPGYACRNACQSNCRPLQGCGEHIEHSRCIRECNERCDEPMSHVPRNPACIGLLCAVRDFFRTVFGF